MGNEILKIALWIKSLFTENKTPIVHNTPIDKPPIKEQCTKEDYCNELNDDWTLKELLGEIDKTYEWLEASVWKNSWIHPCIVNAANTIAPYILRSDYMFDSIGYTEKFNYSKYNFPAIGCVALNSANNETFIGLKSVLYVKQQNLPWDYEQIKGITYLIGYCYEAKGKVLYVSMYVVLDYNGFVRIPKIFRTIEHTIRKGNKISASWFQNTYARQEVVINHKHDQSFKTYALAEKSMAGWVCWVLNVSIERDFNYSVIVKKNNRRVCFSLQGQNIVKFFRNRFKVETTKTGRRKTIFHSVKSFVRKSGAVVKMHVRGVTKFIWGDYNVSIFVPGYHGQGLTEVGIASVQIKESILKDGKSQDFIPIDKISTAIIDQIENRGTMRTFNKLDDRQNGH